MTDYSIVRDFYGRPYISVDGGPLQFEPGRKTPTNAEPYTRISTLSGALDDSKGLVKWAAAHAMLGMAKSKAIQAQVAHLASAYESPWYSTGKKPLQELVEKAQDLGGAGDAAGLGTAFHGLCEVLDKGETPQFVPDELAPWIEAQQAALSDFEPFLVEPFVVCDGLRVAGNPDRYLRHKPTGIVYASDIKTGSDEPRYPLKVSIQVSIAANSVLYNQETGERTPIDCDKLRGILVHTPIRAGGMPRCDLYWLDLRRGWELANLAALVRDSKKMGKLVRVGEEPGW